MTTDEIKKQLESCEVQSLKFEGVVYVSKGKAYRDGEELRMSDSKWRSLWREYVSNEDLI